MSIQAHPPSIVCGNNYIKMEKKSGENAKKRNTNKIHRGDDDDDDRITRLCSFIIFSFY